MSKALLDELPVLTDAGIITPETARQIEAYYAGRKEEAPNKFIAILGILGTLLAGLGIVLLIAHNWENLGRTVQTILAFLPLAIGQGLCIYTLLKQKQNVLWRECSAVFLFFAVASCISLISQVYHIGGSLSDFLLIWMLLTIPLVYIMPSSVVSLLYIAGITWYAIFVGYYHFLNTQIPYLYLGLLALVLPRYNFYRRYNNSSNFFHLHNWFLVLSVTLTLGCFVNKILSDTQWVSAGYLLLFCTWYLVGRTGQFRQTKLYANPFLIIGTTGILLTLFWWSYDDVWRSLQLMGQLDSNFWQSPFAYISVLLLIISAVLVARAWQKKEDSLFDPAGLSGFLFLLLLLLNIPLVTAFIVNVWVLVIAVYFIRKGAMRNHFGILNFGLVIIALLALVRFFDDEIPFLWRGIFFMATGISFFCGQLPDGEKKKSVNSK